MKLATLFLGVVPCESHKSHGKAFANWSAEWLIVPTYLYQVDSIFELDMSEAL